MKNWISRRRSVGDSDDEVRIAEVLQCDGTETTAALALCGAEIQTCVIPWKKPQSQRRGGELFRQVNQILFHGFSTRWKEELEPEFFFLLLSSPSPTHPGWF